MNMYMNMKLFSLTLHEHVHEHEAVQLDTGLMYILHDMKLQ